MVNKGSEKSISRGKKGGRSSKFIVLLDTNTTQIKTLPAVASTHKHGVFEKHGTALAWAFPKRRRGDSDISGKGEQRAQVCLSVPSPIHRWSQMNGPETWSETQRDLALSRCQGSRMPRSEREICFLFLSESMCRLSVCLNSINGIMA